MADVMTKLDLAADALRRHEQGHKKLNDWTSISSAQRKKWRVKASIIVDAYHQGQPNG